MMGYGVPFQAGYVVPDLDAALQHWIRRMKVGPFFLYPRPVPIERVVYRGTVLDRTDIIQKVAVGYAGDMMIELIEPGPAPSAYHEFLEAGGTGLHHIGAVAKDFDGVRAHMLADGATIVMEGSLPGASFCYLEFGNDPPGTIYEIMDGSEARARKFAAFKAASLDWDGQDPIREAADVIA